MVMVWVFLWIRGDCVLVRREFGIICGFIFLSGRSFLTFNSLRRIEVLVFFR